MTAGPRSDFRILIVEDHADAAATLALYLRTATGFTVTVAEDGEAGIEAALRDRPDVVICDINLPKKDGIAVAEEVRRAVTPRPLLLALTARGDLADRLFAAGYDRYFVKPADPAAIATVVALHAGLRRARLTPPGTPDSPGPG